MDWGLGCVVLSLVVILVISTLWSALYISVIRIFYNLLFRMNVSGLITATRPSLSLFGCASDQCWYLLTHQCTPSASPPLSNNNDRKRITNTPCPCKKNSAMDRPSHQGHRLLIRACTSLILPATNWQMSELFVFLRQALIYTCMHAYTALFSLACLAKEGARNVTASLWWST